MKHWADDIKELVVKNTDFGVRHTLVQVPDELLNSNGTLGKLLSPEILSSLSIKWE